MTIRSPQDALDHGIAYLSEDRRKLGLSMPQSVTANISLPVMSRYTGPGHLVDRSAEYETAELFRVALSIRTPSLDTPVDNLSGGNQQKVMLAKWLNTEPRIMILDEPTRGIDVGAKADVHRLIDELASQGMAVIMISSDLPEVLAMSDRILVMREGRRMALIERDAVRPGTGDGRGGGWAMTATTTEELASTRRGCADQASTWPEPRTGQGVHARSG